MQSGRLFPLVLLALGTLVPWTVEGAGNSLKAGACPPVTPGRCLNVFETPECQSDWQCPGRKICCSDACGIRCLDPVISDQTCMKPGKCPVVNGRCLILNPTNHCETDQQCVGDFKCCRGLCGKACVEPESA
ncbi:antileukoproteinase [Leopardus geoffroyi]|uniref:antileukoproteinase n=1 Tax=Leopardus geoffroyi TaxID=46844 RepID=UPI001E264690|nr:antileukoproteinase [Leopardus geoffroyi]